MRAMELVITLLVVGAILLVLETILPGMIAGILGLFCLLAGIIQSFITFGPRTGSYVLAGVVLALMIGTVIWVKFFPQTPMARVFTSRSTVGDIGTERPELLHQTGHALTPLRPSGTAVINGHRIDVVTEGGLIARNTPIIVVAVEGMRVVVRAVSETSTQQPT
jgi:membrane-bound serine protease (ClpP class)